MRRFNSFAVSISTPEAPVNDAGVNNNHSS